jgi:hypothetical protein
MQSSAAGGHPSITTGPIKARLSEGWLKKADRFPSNSPDRRKLAKCIGRLRAWLNRIRSLTRITTKWKLAEFVTHP